MVKLQSGQIWSDASGYVVESLFVQVLAPIQTEVPDLRVVADEVEDPAGRDLKVNGNLSFVEASILIIITMTNSNASRKVNRRQNLMNFNFFVNF
jgi:hypothetical protein